MAKTLSKPRSILFILFTIFFFSTYAIADETPVFSKNLPPSSLGLNQQKLSHLHFYFHDIVSGPKPTAVRVAQAATTNKSPTGFGAVAVIDDPLTLLPENTSKVVGQAQGIYTLASQSEAALLMVLNFAFTEGEYNGSTLSVLGRNTVFSNVREMPIVGGSGVFRFARGYAQAKTYTFDTKSGDAVVEYNVYDTLSTNGQKTPTSTASVGDGIAATTSTVFVTKTTTWAGEARVTATSAEDSNSKDVGQEEEQTLEDLRTYN
nr:dirigent protein 21 [Quercus suber]